MKPHNELSYYFQKSVEAGAVKYVDQFSKMTIKQMKQWCIEKNEENGDFFFPFGGTKARLITSLAHYASWYDLYHTDNVFKSLETYRDKLIENSVNSITNTHTIVELLELREIINLAINRIPVDAEPTYYHNEYLSKMLETAKSAPNPIEALEVNGVNSHQIMELALAINTGEK